MRVHLMILEGLIIKYCTIVGVHMKPHLDRMVEKIPLSEDEINSTALMIQEVAEHVADSLYPEIGFLKTGDLVRSMLFDEDMSCSLQTMDSIFTRLMVRNDMVDYDIDRLREAARIRELEIVRSDMRYEDTIEAVCLNVFCHSYDFWSEAIESEYNPWHNFINVVVHNESDYCAENPDKNIFQKIGLWVKDKIEKIKKKYNKEIVLHCDALGAVQGAVNAANNIKKGEIDMAQGAINSAITSALYSAIGPLVISQKKQ